MSASVVSSVAASSSTVIETGRGIKPGERHAGEDALRGERLDQRGGGYRQPHGDLVEEAGRQNLDLRDRGQRVRQLARLGVVDGREPAQADFAQKRHMDGECKRTKS